MHKQEKQILIFLLLVGYILFFSIFTSVISSTASSNLFPRDSATHRELPVPEK